VHGTAFDWFCAGITLHELLTGRRPFEAVRLQKYFQFEPHEGLSLDCLQRHSHLSTACRDFVTRLLHPLVGHGPSLSVFYGCKYRYRQSLLMQAKQRLGCNGFASIASHHWFKDLSLFDGTVVEVMKLELPHVFLSHYASSSSSSCSHNTGNKLNVGKDEAQLLIRRHSELHSIPDPVQEVFKKYV
jgi:serine/threonine protein kinase